MKKVQQARLFCRLAALALAVSLLCACGGTNGADNTIGSGNTPGSAPAAASEPAASEPAASAPASSAPAADDPMAAAAAAYRAVLAQPDAYDYSYEKAYMDPVEPSGVYRYALLWMGSPAYYDAPTLLVMQEGAAGFNLVKPFQYYSKFDGEAKDHGAIGEGFAESIGWHVSLFVPEERNGLIAEEYYDQHPDNVET